MGKGSQRRPRLISTEEETLRFRLAFGDIDRKAFDCEMEKLKDGNQKDKKR